jgi:hypothetical protein
VTIVLYVEHNDDNLYMLKTRLELRGDFEVLPRPSNPRGAQPRSRGWITKIADRTGQVTRKARPRATGKPRRTIFAGGRFMSSLKYPA